MRDEHHTPPATQFIPVMGRERFAELTGFSVETVRGWEAKGYLPTIKVGKHRLVNLAALTRQALEEEEY